MERLEQNRCIIDALAVAIDVDKMVIKDMIVKKIENDEYKFNITDLTSKKVQNLGKLDRQYHKPGHGKVWRKMSVQSFLKLYKEGTYYIRTVKTAACVKNGFCVVGEPSTKDGIVEAFKIL